MSTSDLFTPELWRGVADQLRGTASDWWDRNKDSIVELGTTEARAIFGALKVGDSVVAKREMAKLMNDEDWAAYRDATTNRLADIATRRAQFYRALGELGIKAMRLVGSTVMGALG